MAKQEEETIKHDVRHRFVCEHCGEMSEWGNSTIEGKTQEEIFDSKIPDIQKEVAKNNYLDLLQLNGKCTKCKKRQSWEKTTAKKIMKRSAGIGILAAGSLGWVCWILFGLSGFIAVFVIVTLCGFIVGLVEYIRVTSDMKKTSRRNVPEIDWMYIPSLEEPLTNK